MGGGGGGGVHDCQLPTFVESKSAKIPNSILGREEGCMTANFQLLILSPNLLKCQSPVGGGEGVHDGQLPTFDAESKSAKIPKSGGGGGVHDGQLPTSNFC